MRAREAGTYASTAAFMAVPEEPPHRMPSLRMSLRDMANEGLSVLLYQ